MEQPTDDQKAAESSKVNDQDGIIDTTPFTNWV